MGLDPISVILTVASAAFQIQKQKRMQQQMEEQLDKTRGLVVTRRGESAAIPVAYGKVALGGIETRHLVGNHIGMFKNSSIASFASAQGLTNTYTGGDNNFTSHATTENWDGSSRGDKRNLSVGYALCHGGIEGVQWVKINDVDYNDPKAKFHNVIQTYNDSAGTYSPLPWVYAGTKAIPPVDTTNDYFSGLAHAVGSFLLDREDPNYSGIPDLKFLVKGRNVKHVVRSGTAGNYTYSLSSASEFSQNPALCLLDYLLNSDFGAGLAESEVDLESFYNSAEVCDTIVFQHAPLGGRINGHKRINSVASFAVLPSNLEKKLYPNDVWFTEDTETYYEWNKTTWVATVYKPFENNIVTIESLPSGGSVTTDSLASLFNFSIDNSENDPSYGEGFIYYVTSEDKYYTATSSGIELTSLDAYRENSEGSLELRSGITPDFTLPFGATPDPADYTTADLGKIIVNGSAGWEIKEGFTFTEILEPEDTTENLRLYQCNLALDTERTVRENITTILDTMGEATITWSSQGKYKLILEYPSTAQEQEDLVDARHEFTEDDIVQDNFSISYGSAEDRLNQVTVSFLNEVEDFKDDDFTWPESGSAAHLAYLAEDNQVRLQASVNGTGITNPYHAQALAEQLVRFSRSAYTVEFVVNRKGLTLEPGDFIKLTVPNADLDGEIFQVLSAKVSSDFTVKVTAFKYDFNALAWNVTDELPYKEPREAIDFSPDAVTSLTYTAGQTSTNTLAVGSLSWQYETSSIFEVSWRYPGQNNEWNLLGVSTTNSFDIVNPPFEDGSLVNFRVVARTPLGTFGAPSFITNQEIALTPEAPTSGTTTEGTPPTGEGVSVAPASQGVYASWSAPASGVAVAYYLVEYKLSSASEFTTFGTTVNTSVFIPQVNPGTIDIKITPFSHINVSGASLETSITVTGDTTPPAVPTNLSVDGSFGYNRVTWTNPSDTDFYLAKVYVGETSVEVDATLEASINSDTFVHGNLDPNTTRYYWVSAVDFAGNESAKAGPISGQTTQITVGDIQDAVIPYTALDTTVTDVFDDLASDIVLVESDITTINTTLADKVDIADYNITVDYQQQLEDATSQLATDALALALNASSLESRINDAGITVDPATGSVTIQGLSAIENRVSTAELDLDAVEASLTLKASTSYVDSAIAAATLPEATLAELENTIARVDTAEIDIDALEGAITLTSTGSLYNVNDGTLGVEALEGRITVAEGEIDLKATQSDLDDAEARLTTAEVTLSGIDSASIALNVQEVHRLSEDLGDLSELTLQEVLGRYNDRQYLSQDVALARLSLTADVNDQKEALAEARLELAAQIDTNVASIEQVSTAVADETSARVSADTTLQADIDGVDTGLQEVINLDATAGHAIVNQFLTLQGEVSDPDTGLVAAFGEITQLNNVDVTSTSALVQDYLSLKGAVNNEDTGLVAAFGEITQLNTVDLTSTSALTQRFVGLEGAVNNETTGLAAAQASINEINTVDVNSDSAIARSVANLNSTVNDPTTGLAAAIGEINEINTVDVTSDSAIARSVATLDSTVNDPTTGLASTRATLINDYYTSATADSAISSAITAFESSNITGVYATNANLTNNYYTIATADSAISSAITSNNVTIGDTYATISTVSTVSDKVGDVEAKYGVTIDNNGNATGFQLLSGIGGSAFNVRADQFAIFSTDGATSDTPFTVFTSARVIDGVTYPAGTYIRDAFIDQAAIVALNADDIEVGTLNAERISIDGVTLDTDGSGNLIIAEGGVDTPEIATNAVTKSTSSTGSLTLNFTAAAGDSVLIGASGVLSNSLQGDNAQTGTISISFNGSTIYSATFPIRFGAGEELPITMLFSRTTQAGTNTIQVVVTSGNQSTASFDSPNLFALETFR